MEAETSPQSHVDRTLQATTPKAGYVYLLASPCRRYICIGATVKSNTSIAQERAGVKVFQWHNRHVIFTNTMLYAVSDVFWFRDYLRRRGFPRLNYIQLCGGYGEQYQKYRSMLLAEMDFCGKELATWKN